MSIKPALWLIMRTTAAQKYKIMDLVAGIFTLVHSILAINSGDLGQKPGIAPEHWAFKWAYTHRAARLTSQDSVKGALIDSIFQAVLTRAAVDSLNVDEKTRQIFENLRVAVTDQRRIRAEMLKTAADRVRQLEEINRRTRKKLRLWQKITIVLAVGAGTYAAARE